MNQEGDADRNKVIVHFIKWSFNPSKNKEHAVVFTMSWVAVPSKLPHPYICTLHQDLLTHTILRGL